MTEPKRKPGRPPGSKNKTSAAQPESAHSTNRATNHRVQNEIVAILFVIAGIFLIIAMQTGAAGQLGRGLSDILKGLFGHIALLIPYALLLYGAILFAGRTAQLSCRSALFLLVFFVTAAILNSGRFIDLAEIGKWSGQWFRDCYTAGIDLAGGGVIGMNLGYFLIRAIGRPGLYLTTSGLLFISLLLLFNTPISQFWDSLTQRRQTRREAAAAHSTVEPNQTDRAAAATEAEPPTDAEPFSPRPPNYVSPFTDPETGLRPKQTKIIDYVRNEQWSTDHAGGEPETGPASGSNLTASTADEPTRSKSRAKSAGGPVDEIIVVPQEAPDPAVYRLPPIELLSKSLVDVKTADSVSLQAKAVKLEQTLRNFGVSAKVLQVIKGPAVTRYEIQPDIGVKVSSIVRLADDIALNLEARSIRLEAPIPGKAAVGIEVENERINLVTAREIIDSAEFKKAKSHIAFALGKDISGRAIVADLKEMPHLLIAGSTGSGKSVCLNTLIVSLLYRARPDEVKLVLIDPKVVELGNYNGIPHLLIPVVTEPTKAAGALNWAVAEMTDRYKKFAAAGVRDLESFNAEARKNGEPEHLIPQIVIIIDELADLMMAAPNQVEESICRLAQMARAAGMHLIVATQRPSVDIITGVIKANIPSRISFAVSSQFDSRTILDMAGAEKLVGKGDMLFNPIGLAKPMRVQGAFISDTEVHKVIEFLKQQVPETEYASDVLNRIERTVEAPDNDSDELLQEAIETVVRAEQASVSMLQRRFRIGYNRAARLVDMMEARGIVGPSDGSRPRKVLLTEEDLIRLGRDDDDYDDDDDN